MSTSVTFSKLPEPPKTGSLRINWSLQGDIKSCKLEIHMIGPNGFDQFYDFSVNGFGGTTLTLPSGDYSIQCDAQGINAYGQDDHFMINGQNSISVVTGGNHSISLSITDY